MCEAVQVTPCSEERSGVANGRCADEAGVTPALSQRESAGAGTRVPSAARRARLRDGAEGALPRSDLCPGAAVPGLFGTRVLSRGRQFSHELGWRGGGSGMTRATGSRR